MADYCSQRATNPETIVGDPLNGVVSAEPSTAPLLLLRMNKSKCLLAVLFYSLKLSRTHGVCHFAASVPGPESSLSAASRG